MVVRNHLALHSWRLYQSDASYTIAPYVIHMMLHGLYVLGSSAHCVWPNLSCLPSLGLCSELSSNCVSVVDLTDDPDDGSDEAFIDAAGSDGSNLAASPILMVTPESSAVSSDVASVSSQNSSSVLASHSTTSSSIISLSVTVDSTSSIQTTSSGGDSSPNHLPCPPHPSPPLPSPCYSPLSSLDLNDVYFNIYSPPMRVRPSPSPLSIPESMSFYEPSPSLSPFDPEMLVGWSPEPTYRLDPYNWD